MIESVLPPRTLPFASIAMYDSSSLSFGRRLQIAAAHLDAEQHRRVRRRALERRGEHVHRQAADRQRAVERLAHFGVDATVGFAGFGGRLPFGAT